MADRRARERRGLLWSALALVVLLTMADLARGLSSLLRSWWRGLAAGESTPAERLLEEFREDPARQLRQP